MGVIDDSIAEIEEFASNFQVNSFFLNGKAKAKFRIAYKQMHAILIWSILVERKAFPECKFGVHPKEAISDLSHAFGLTVFSLYKPARMMCRSGIENVVRMIVAKFGGDYTVNSVYVLFDIARSCLSNDVAAVKLLDQLRDIYSDLCLTVHSAHPEHLALRIPLPEAFLFDESQFNVTVLLISRTVTAVNHILFAVFASKLDGLEHKNRDFVLDCLPKLLKRAVLN